MNRQAKERARELQDAFHAFNQISLQLQASYRELEQRVAVLSEELAAARSERLLQLTEKERLANRLRRLLDALPGGVIVLDGAGVVQDCNPAAVALLGEPLCGVVWRDVVCRAFAPQAAEDGEAALRDERRVNVSTRPLVAEPGQILLLQDVTETRALQERVNRHQRLSAMGEMVARLAHQIRTPLAGALLYVSHLARPGLSPAELQRVTDKIRTRLRHLEHMVNDMLLFARGGANAAEEIALQALIEAFAQALEPQLQACAGRLDIAAGVPDVRLHGNREALLGALLNLGTNAIQACGQGARLSLEARACGADVQIALRDNGPGVSQHVRDHLFEPFFTTRPDGTGLGLAVVRAVVAAHHGAVWVESQSGSGATFVVQLSSAQVPRQSPPLDAPAGWRPEWLKNDPVPCIRYHGSRA